MRIEATDSHPAGEVSAETLLLSVITQYRTDLASAHAEICRLSGLDPEAHSWPEWSPQANTLRWLDKIAAVGSEANETPKGSRSSTSQEGSN